MKRIGPLVFTAAIAAASGVSVAQASPTDDQAAADAAVAAFNERMTEAGGIGSPAPDITPIDPADEAELEPEANPLAGCLGEFATALDPSGRIEGETARAFSDDFTFTGPDAPVTTDLMELAMVDSDNVSASVITVGEGQEDVLDGLIELAGSDEFEACFQQIFETPITYPAEVGTMPADYAMPEFEISTESDIGVGDTSALMTFSTSSTVGEEVYASNSISAIARTGRSLVTVSLNTSTAEPLSDVDVEAELAALADAL